jgi:hypothetical protein
MVGVVDSWNREIWIVSTEMGFPPTAGKSRIEFCWPAFCGTSDGAAVRHEDHEQCGTAEERAGSPIVTADRRWLPPSYSDEAAVVSPTATNDRFRLLDSRLRDGQNARSTAASQTASGPRTRRLARPVFSAARPLIALLQPF